MYPPSIAECHVDRQGACRAGAARNERMGKLRNEDNAEYNKARPVMVVGGDT